MKDKNKKESITRYRGLRSAFLIRVLEGDGINVPFENVLYVAVYEKINGEVFPKTLGKVVPLTEEESRFFHYSC